MEDFTTYATNRTDSSLYWTVSSNRFTGLLVPCNDDTGDYYKARPIGTTFQHCFDFQITAYTGVLNAGLWSVASNDNSRHLDLYWAYNGSNGVVVLSSTDGSGTVSTSYNVGLMPHYLLIVRAGDSLQAYFYSDAAHTTLMYTASITIQDASYTYDVVQFVPVNNASNSNTVSLWLENADLGYNAAGSITFDGSASSQLGSDYDGSGEMDFDGAGTFQAGSDYNGSGGVSFGGAGQTTGFNYVTSGQLAFAGSGTEQATYIKAGSGGIQLPGSSVRQATYIPIAGPVVFHNGFRYRKAVTIPSGAVQEDLSAFPVFVSLDLSGKLATTHDFTFEETDESYLHYDVDSLTGGILKAWVIVPTIQADQPTVFYVYFNKPTQTSSLESNGYSQYVNVYHLNGTYRDVAGGNNGTGHGYITDITGMFSTGEQFTGNGYIALGSDGIPDTAPLTVSAWIKTNPYQVEDRVVYSRGNFALGYDTSGHLWASVKTSGGTARLTSNASLTPGSWYHVAATWQPKDIITGATTLPLSFPFMLGYADQPSSPLFLFVNGELDNSTVIADYLDPASSGFIGHQYGSNYSGCIDEVRVARDAKSEAWIKAEYDTGSNNYLLGPEEAAFNLAGSATAQIDYVAIGSGSVAFSGSSTRFVAFSCVGSGGIIFDGTATERATYRKAGAGSVQFSGHGTSGVAFAKTGAGGIIFAGQSQRQATYIKTGAGGVVFAGTAKTTASLARSSTGGIVFAGSSTKRAAYKPVGAGSIAFSGAAETTETSHYNGSGRIVWAGDGASLADYLPVSSGQIRFNGHSRATTGFVRSGSGGIVFNGSATRRATYKRTTGGGLQFGGTATTQAGYRFVGQGGLVFSGQAALSTFYPMTSGGIVFAGEATEQATYTTSGSGRIVFGSPPIHGIKGNVASFPAFSGKVSVKPALRGVVKARCRFALMEV